MSVFGALTPISKHLFHFGGTFMSRFGSSPVFVRPPDFNMPRRAAKAAHERTDADRASLKAQPFSDFSRARDPAAAPGPALPPERILQRLQNQLDVLRR